MDEKNEMDKKLLDNYFESLGLEEEEVKTVAKTVMLKTDKDTDPTFVAGYLAAFVDIEAITIKEAEIILGIIVKFISFLNDEGFIVKLPKVSLN